MNIEQQIKDEMEAGNVALARFMGWTSRTIIKSSYSPKLTMWDKPYSGEGMRYSCEEGYLSFFVNWDWLMPVVEKIETVDLELYGRMTVVQSHNHCHIYSESFSEWQRTKGESGSDNTYFGDHYGKDKKEATFIACVAFVGWLEKGIESGELKYKE